jgi:hypothetical protein
VLSQIIRDEITNLLWAPHHRATDGLVTGLARADSLRRLKRQENIFTSTALGSLFVYIRGLLLKGRKTM